MRTDIISYILKSEKRKKIVITIFESPKRQWSCSTLEDLSRLPHATVFRTLQTLKDFGILKTVRINRKDVVYLLSESPFIYEIKRIFSIDTSVMKKIAERFAKKIASKDIESIILYGSSLKGNIKPDSDVDILVVINKEDKLIEEKIYDEAASMSSKINKTISPVIISKNELNKEKKNQFISSVKANMEVLYGKRPFWTVRNMV